MGFFGKMFKKDELDTSFDLGRPGSDPMMSDPLSGGDPLAHTDPMMDDSGMDKYGGRQNSMNNPMGSFAPDPTMQPTGKYPQNPGMPGRSQPVQQSQQPIYDEEPSRDVELILAKLDAIKAELDSVHQRVRKLESIADAKNGQKKYW